MKNLEPQIELYTDCITARFDNRRIIIYPHKTGISFIFKRALAENEKEKLANDPNFNIISAGSSIIKNRILQTDISLTYEAAFVLNGVLNECQKEIRIRQIINTVLSEDTKSEGLMILNKASVDEIQQISEIFEKGDHNIVCLELDTIKRRLCVDGVVVQNETDNFGKSLI